MQKKGESEAYENNITSKIISKQNTQLKSKQKLQASLSNM